MESVILGLSIVTWIAAFAGWLWIVVAAFGNDDTAWGLGCLFLSPVAFVYAILNFGELKVPLLILIFASIAQIILLIASAAIV